MQSFTIILSEAQIEKGISSVARSLHFYDFVRESSPWPFLGGWGVSLHGTYIPPCQSKPTQHKIPLTRFLMPHLSWPRRTWLMPAIPDSVPLSNCRWSPWWWSGLLGQLLGAAPAIAIMHRCTIPDKILLLD